jgi:hypothetical protein
MNKCIIMYRKKNKNKLELQQQKKSFFLNKLLNLVTLWKFYK